MPADTAFMDKLTALCKRRGFIYQSSEIYGGIGGFWDYGPLGVELKRNIKDLWWHDMVTNPPTGPDGREVEMVGVDCSIIMNPKVWEASGHATGFADPMRDCRECKARFRSDWLLRCAFFEVPSIPELVDIHDLLKSLRERRPYRTFLHEQGKTIEDHTAAAKRVLNAKRLKWKIVPQADNPSIGQAFCIADDKKLYYYQSYEGHTDDLARCPSCGGELTEPRLFNLMFKTYVGALEDAGSMAYLRPETAQGIFVNYKNVLDTTRVKVPFGIAQVGKSFRNEINPRNYTFRSREFEQMEIEFFCHEPDSMQWYEFWRKVRYDWYVNLGLKSEKLRLRDQGPEELAHYSKACADIEYLFPFSDEFQELEGVAHRGNFDLTQHQKFSGKDLTYFDDEAWQRDKDQFADDKDGEHRPPAGKEAGGTPTLPGGAAAPSRRRTPDEEKAARNAPPYRFLPTVIEPSAGADRAALAFLCEAYCEDQAPDDKGAMQTRVVMKFHPKLAPIKVAVFPLVKKEGMPDIAEAIYRDVKKHMTAFYDDKGAVGRRYRRQDEAGTPFCVTVDGDTLKDGTVTIRDRDTLAQIRLHKDQVVAWLKEKLAM
jgi:glycyl-tRNA synthetase